MNRQVFPTQEQELFKDSNRILTYDVENFARTFTKDLAGTWNVTHSALKNKTSVF
jgi:hypothetical protein